jgi:zinc transport system substrate-binding protein
MAGVGIPHLLVAGGASPHAFSLKPSDAAALEAADVVIWVGEGMETFLAGPVAVLAPTARLVTLSEAPGLELLPNRAGGIWAEEADEDHTADHEHAHADHDAEEEHHDHDAEEELHDHGADNLHVWLDPERARIMAGEIAAALGDADPLEAARYRANAVALDRRLAALTAEMATGLAPLRGRRFIVFHDAYPYLEQRFGLAAAGSITLSPERQPGAARIAEIRAAVAGRAAVCVLAEPQFRPALVDVVVEGTPARAGVLDPLGADIAPGPELYFELMRRAVASLTECLIPAS